MFNPFQRTCAATYGDGDFAHVQNIDEARDAHDTLFTFLMVELDTAEGCTDREEAVRRLEMAQANIQDVIDAVQTNMET